MQRFIITPFQRLSWSVNRKVTLCFALLVLLIIGGSTVVFVSILTLESNSNAERHKSLEVDDARAFDVQLSNQISAYNVAIYQTQQQVINSSYSLEVQDSLTRLKADDPTQLQNKDSLLYKLDASYQELAKVFKKLDGVLFQKQVTAADQIWTTNSDLRNYVTNTSSQFQKQLNAENAAIIEQRAFLQLSPKPQP